MLNDDVDDYITIGHKTQPTNQRGLSHFTADSELCQAGLLSPRTRLTAYSRLDHCCSFVPYGNFQLYIGEDKSTPTQIDLFDL